MGRSSKSKGRPRMELRALLEAAGAPHRRAVAGALGIGGQPSAIALAEALSGERLGEVADGLPERARAALTGGAFRADGAAPLTYGGPGANGHLIELERHGLAFAFTHSWRGWHEYRIPQDLLAPLQRMLAARHAEGVAPAKPARFAAAPLQTLHDAAALWAFAARTPIRVKADGDIYARVWPKLDAALPPLNALPDPGFDRMRVGLALDFLREEGQLRLRVDDLPGRDARRELVPAGNLLETLADEPEGLRSRLVELAFSGSSTRACVLPLTEALAGRVVGLESLGASLRELLDAVSPQQPWPGQEGVDLALSALGPLWLAGGIELGLSSGGEPVAARFAPVPLEQSEGALAVCQSSFDLVLLRPPTPAERSLLELCCEPVAGQEHVYRLTRDSVRSAERLAHGVPGASEGLRSLAGELPQNVARSVEDWARAVRPPLRLRSAMIVDTGDPEVAEELCAGPFAALVVERLGERLLAVPARELAAVQEALAAAGRELEPGLDRVSGVWHDAPSRSWEATSLWSPSPEARAERPEREPPGRLISTLEQMDRAEPRRRGADDRAESPRGAPSATGVSDDALDVLLEALDAEMDAEIVYAGARGITVRRITPLEIDDARLRAWCHLRDDERSFWLSSILEAEPVAD